MSRDTFLRQLITQKDNLQVSFFEDYKLVEILKTICAFLNTDGGWVIIGHSGKKLAGLDSINEKLDELKSEIANKIIPQPLVYVQEEIYNRKDLILINVLKGTRQPYSLKGNNFVRRGNKTVIANQDEISLLLRKPNEFASTWEKLTAIDVTINELDDKEIYHTIEEAAKLGRGKSIPNNSEGFLNYFQLFDFDSVKNGAVVLFGDDPVKYLPQCRIRITVMPHGKTGSSYRDSIIIEDHLFQAFNQVHKYFQQQLPMISEFSDNEWNRTDHERHRSQWHGQQRPLGDLTKHRSE